MKIQVEFTGYTRQLLGRKTLDMQYQEAPTYSSIIRELASRFPQLVGLLINQDRQTLMSGNLIILNGNMATAALDMDAHPQDGDHLIIMSLVTGG